VQSSRPFAEHAERLAGFGLAVIPCPGKDGKAPEGAISGFQRWRRPPGTNTIRKFAEQWGDANIGVITSLSGVTVLDIDGDEKIANEVARRAGESRLSRALRAVVNISGISRKVRETPISEGWGCRSM
jgi:hypothetical protein